MHKAGTINRRLSGSRGTMASPTKNFPNTNFPNSPLTLLIAIKLI